MAHDKFDGTPEVNKNALAGDAHASKISYNEVMPKPEDRDVIQLRQAIEASDKAVKAAIDTISNIHQRAALYHPEGLAGFLKNHEAQYV